MGKFAAIVLQLTVCGTAVGDVVPEITHIAFGRLPDGTSTTEGLPISDQYAAYGIWFSLADGSGFPIIAQEGNGNPPVAFLSDTNDLVCSGTFGLTDPIGKGGDITSFRPIRIDLDPPARSFRFLCGHPTGSDFPVVKYFVEHSETEVLPIECPGPNGACQLYESGPSSGARITHIIVENPQEGQPYGFTISRMTVVRDPQPLAGAFVRVAQESSPGQGDFDENVVAILRPWRAPVGAAPRMADVYLYGTANFNDVSYGGLPEVLDLDADASRFGFFEASEGLSLVVVHDRPKQQCPDDFTNGGGHAEVLVAFDGITPLPAISIVDDRKEAKEDLYTLDSSTATFSALSTWTSPNTDGFALSGLADDWSMIISFTEVDDDLLTSPFEGLTSWAAKTTDGPLVPLNLQPDLRVELRAICMADTNGNCRVDSEDLVSFGDCMDGPGQPVIDKCRVFDVDPDGDVDLRDFGRLGSAFNGF